MYPANSDCLEMLLNYEKYSVDKQIINVLFIDHYYMFKNYIKCSKRHKSFEES